MRVGLFWRGHRTKHPSSLAQESKSIESASHLLATSNEGALTTPFAVGKAPPVQRESETNVSALRAIAIASCAHSTRDNCVHIPRDAVVRANFNFISVDDKAWERTKAWEWESEQV